MGVKFAAEALGALQATISVLLVILFGATTVKYLKLISSDVVDEVTRLGTNILLPALLFSEMGAQSSPQQLAEYWILPVACTVFTIFSLLYAFIGVKLLRMPNWMYPAAAFPNMLSLPLLMVQSLAKTGSLGKLLNGPDDTVDKVADRARVYFLVSALAGNIIRFAIGPYFLRENGNDNNRKPESADGNRELHIDPERQPLLHRVVPGEVLPNQRDVNDNSLKAKIWRVLFRIAYLRHYFNPPLVAGLLAILFGMIAPTRHALFDEDGILSPSLTQSIKTLGELYTGMQMFMLGGKLVSKSAGRAKFWPLLYLCAWRFALMPLATTSLVYFFRSRYPEYIKQDPMLDFVIAFSHVGPPAITLAAMAEMAGLDAKEQGVIATVLLASYIVTPLMSLSVSGIIVAIKSAY